MCEDTTQGFGQQPTEATPPKDRFADPTAEKDFVPGPIAPLVDELDDVRAQLSRMMGEDMKPMRKAAPAVYNPYPPIDLAERDRQQERRKLQNRETELMNELRSLRMEALSTW